MWILSYFCDQAVLFCRKDLAHSSLNHWLQPDVWPGILSTLLSISGELEIILNLLFSPRTNLLSRILLKLSKVICGVLFRGGLNTCLWYQYGRCPSSYSRVTWLIFCYCSLLRFSVIVQHLMLLCYEPFEWSHWLHFLSASLSKLLVVYGIIFKF